jgi:hypothetical protein
MRAMTRIAGFLICALVACSEEDTGPPPLAEVEGHLQSITVNDTSIFALDGNDSTVVELTIDGMLVGKLPNNNIAVEVVAQGDWVAWVEKEGTGYIVRRRKAGMVESLRLFAPRIVASQEGLFYSDLGIIASWIGPTPERIATPEMGATVIAVDAGFAYTREQSTAIMKYPRSGDPAEMLLPSSMGASVSTGQLAYVTAEGLRLRDLFTMFDRVVGTPPATVTCEPLIAGRAVVCGKYRGMEGVTEEILKDPVTAYTAVGKNVYWISRGDKDTKSKIFVTDAEIVLKKDE